MNLNPFRWFGQKFSNAGGAIAAAQREVDTMGPWSSVLGAGFLPRTVNPHLYEALREAIGLLDGAIDTLVTLDGIIRVEGDNDKLVAEIEDWIDSVPVNDMEAGLQAFYASQGNEVYEQGFNLGEWVPAANGRDIVGLRVADSKGIVFVRTEKGIDAWYRPPSRSTGNHNAGLDALESVLRRTTSLTANTMTGHGYTRLDPSRLLYVVHAPEADNPYGVSKIRSLEFVSQILLRIENAVGQSWTRYGDPPLHLNYKTRNAKVDAVELEKRKEALQKALAAALKSKASGHSMDLVTAVGALDEVSIDVIGAMGYALEPDKPLKAVKEEIFAKFGIPAWLVGLDASPGAGLAERQSEMVLQAAKTRFERRRPGLTQLVATLLRMRGRTWKRGDWRLVQELPNLQDMMKIAQAEFLTAQARQVSGRGGESLTGIDNNLREARSRAGRGGIKASRDDDTAGEPWAEDDDHLPRIERAGIRAALERWWRLADESLALIGFVVRSRQVAPGDADAEEFTFDRQRLGQLLALGERFARENSTSDAPVITAMWEAWVRGWINAAEEIDAQPAVDQFREQVTRELVTRGGELIRSAVGRAYRERVIAALSSGEFDGMNPVTVAAQLQRRFDAGEYDWERLVRSEMAIAQSRGKLEQYRANGYEQYDYTTAGDDRVSDICLALAAGGPYPVNDPASPIPVVSSHPNCRCSIAPHVAK